jgi:hypothetical protein
MTNEQIVEAVYAQITLKIMGAYGRETDVLDPDTFASFEALAREVVFETLCLARPMIEAPSS